MRRISLLCEENLRISSPCSRQFGIATTVTCLSRSRHLPAIFLLILRAISGWPARSVRRPQSAGGVIIRGRSSNLVGARERTTISARFPMGKHRAVALGNCSGFVSTSFTVRIAAPEDARTIAEIHVEASRAAYGMHLPSNYFDGFTVANRMSAWSKMIANQSEREQIIVGEGERNVCGYAHFGPSRDLGAPRNVGELYSLYVASQHWRRGFGKGLLAASLQGLARMQFDTATLWVLAANQPARTFYERFGWVADGAEKAAQRQMMEVRYRAPVRRLASSGDNRNGLPSL